MPMDPKLEPRTLVERYAANLLRELATQGHGWSPLRVTDAAAGLACMVLVWPADDRMPTALSDQPKPRKIGGRKGCREDILAVVRAAGRPLTRKQVIRALKAAGSGHGAGTIAKALADLTGGRELINLKDKRGYRLPGWIHKHPGLFDDV